MSAKKRVDESESTATEMDAFQPDMSKLNAEFDLEALIVSFQEKSKDSSARKISYADRVAKAKINIGRIQAMINQLENKSLSESAMIWVGQVIRPIVNQLEEIYPNAKLTLTGPYGLSGDVTLTMTKRNNAPGSKPESRFVTFTPAENASVALRNFRENTNEWTPGTIQAISNWNHPTVKIPTEKPIETIIEWLMKV